MKRIQDFYTSLIENKKSLRKALIIISIIITIYYLIDAFTNYNFSYFIVKEIWLGIYISVLLIISKIFHELFGKWFIHESRLRMSRLYVKEKMPRSLKFDGYTGVGKDSTVNAIRKVFQEDIIEKINEEMDLIQVVCYPYDFNSLNEVLDKNRYNLMTNSKNSFFSEFIRIMKDNNCFIKKWYSKDFDVSKHLDELYQMKNDPYDLEAFQNIEYKYNNGITPQHYLTLLIKYCMLYIRINFLDSFLMTNQPTMETETKPAKLFSTKFTNIQKDNSEWPWPIDGNIIIIETESDGLYPNVGAKGQSPMKTGLRNFKAFSRHLLGEASVWINIGQKASRTTKTLRELDHAYIKVIEQSKVYGGEKRIYFINKWLSWVEFWIRKSLRKKSKERQLKRRSRIYELIRRLENTGYIYVDIKVSRNDGDLSAEEMSVKKILNYDKPIFENYKVKLVFHIKDFYFGYNTHYINSVAELKAKKTNIQFNEVMTWDKDMILKKKHIEYMAYNILDDIAEVDRNKYEKKLKAEAQAKKASKKVAEEIVKKVKEVKEKIEDEIQEEEKE